MAPRARVEITSHSHDESGTIGYAEGKWNGREFVASWDTQSPVGALFYDDWLDVTHGQCTAIANALTKLGAIPIPNVTV